jgi:hypothetical protein
LPPIIDQILNDGLQLTDKTAYVALVFFCLQKIIFTGRGLKHLRHPRWLKQQKAQKVQQPNNSLRRKLNSQKNAHRFREKLKEGRKKNRTESRTTISQPDYNPEFEAESTKVPMKREPVKEV